MRIVDHPYLAGVKCREDGAVFIPQSGTHKGHWAFGARDHHGYRQVGIARKRCKVHRLICEAFHGACPPDKPEVDHINRNRSDNRPENLRWCSRSENCHNKKVCDESFAKYGVGSTEDRVAYNRALYANNPEYRKRQNARSRARYAKKKKSAG